jgi:hypothetical protein
VWIDEWVCRANGDLFVVFKATSETVYHMRDLITYREAIPLVPSLSDAMLMMAMPVAVPDAMPLAIQPVTSLSDAMPLAVPDAIPLDHQAIPLDQPAIPLDHQAIQHDHNQIIYIVLHVEMRKHRECPDNILYSISINPTLEGARIKVIDLMGRSGHMVSKNQTNRLARLDPVWVAQPNDRMDGDMYRIIRSKHGKYVYLNKYCAQAQPYAHDGLG